MNNEYTPGLGLANRRDPQPRFQLGFRSNDALPPSISQRILSDHLSDNVQPIDDASPPHGNNILRFSPSILPPISPAQSGLKPRHAELSRRESPLPVVPPERAVPSHGLELEPLTPDNRDKSTQIQIQPSPQSLQSAIPFDHYAPRSNLPSPSYHNQRFQVVGGISSEPSRLPQSTPSSTMWHRTPYQQGKIPKGSTDILKAWIHRHSDYPYPSEEEKKDLCQTTGLSMTQVSNYLINARRRILGCARLAASRPTATAHLFPAGQSSAAGRNSSMPNTDDLQFYQSAVLPHRNFVNPLIGSAPLTEEVAAVSGSATPANPPLPAPVPLFVPAKSHARERPVHPTYLPNAVSLASSGSNTANQEFACISPEPFRPDLCPWPDHKPVHLREYVITFITDILPRQIYLHCLLRLPYLYFSRVDRIFQEAELTPEEIKEIMLRAAAEDRKLLHQTWTPDCCYYPRVVNLQLLASLSPQYRALMVEWEHFIDNLMREWKTLNIISVLLLPAIMATLQIPGASEDPVTQHLAFLSLICASMSLLYGCLFIIRFGTIRKPSKAAGWALDVQKPQNAFWNIWVMLAMPIVWLSWSIVSFLVCIMSFMWRAEENVPNLTFAASRFTEEGFRMFICIIFGVGVAYGALIVHTFRCSGTHIENGLKYLLRDDIEEGYDPEKCPHLGMRSLGDGTGAVVDEEYPTHQVRPGYTRAVSAARSWYRRCHDPLPITTTKFCPQTLEKHAPDVPSIRPSNESQPQQIPSIFSSRYSPFLLEETMGRGEIAVQSDHRNSTDSRSLPLNVNPLHFPLTSSSGGSSAVHASGMKGHAHSPSTENLVQKPVPKDFGREHYFPGEREPGTRTSYWAVVLG